MGTGMLVNLPGESQGVEGLFDILEAQLKTAPAGDGTPVTRSLTTNKEWLVTKITERSPDQVKALKGIATAHLELTRAHFEKAKTLRAHYALLGREYGLTNQEIGDALGLTEARVRQLLAAG